MESPKNYWYLAENSISGLLEQLDGGRLTESTKSRSREQGNELQTGAEAGLFAQFLGLGKLSLGTSRSGKRSSSESGTLAVGAQSHVAMILSRLQALKGTSYFESLDDAFASAPEERMSWVQAKDYFDLTNIGAEWDAEALERERRFVFKINPLQDRYDDGDDYYRNPIRPWSLTMSASFENWPRLSGKLPGFTSHEALYFRQYKYAKIPLNVFGSYSRVGLNVLIIPFAIWV